MFLNIQSCVPSAHKKIFPLTHKNQTLHIPLSTTMSHHSSADRHPQPPLFNRCRHYSSTVNTPQKQQQYHHNFPKPQPTSNLSVRNAYYPGFHGGMGDEATKERIQLFEAVNPIHHHLACPYFPFKKPVVGGFMATGGTGVFLPLYHTQAHDLINNKGSCGGGERDKGEHQGRDYDAIPIEKLLPSEWTY